MTDPPPDQPGGNKPAKPTSIGMEDKYAYRIAVGAIGFALVAFLIGAAWIAATGNPVPTQYWSTGSAVAGALMGILAPTPQRRPAASNRDQAAPPKQGVGSTIKAALSALAEAWKDLWANRSLLILMFVFVVSLVFTITQHSAPLEAVAGASGGALVGLLAPPPGQQSSGS